MRLFQKVRPAAGEAALKTTRPCIEPLEARTLMNGDVSDARAGVDGYAHTSALSFDLHHRGSPASTGGAQGIGDLFAGFDTPAIDGSEPARAHLTSRATTADDDVLVGHYTAAARVVEVPDLTPRRTGSVHVMKEQPADNPRQVERDKGAAVHPPTPDRDKGRPGLARSRGRVLVVEDDAASRTALSVILRQRGWEVTMAGTLAEGIRQMATRPDRALVDLVLPDGDGGRLLEYVRDEGLSTRVTVMTGVKDPTRLARIRRLAPESVLSKPLNVADLLRGLSEAA